MATYAKGMRVNVRNDLGDWCIGLLLEDGESFRGHCWLVQIGGFDPRWYYDAELGGDANTPHPREPAGPNLNATSAAETAEAIDRIRWERDRIT